MSRRRSLYAYAMLQSAVEAGASNPVHAVLPLIEHTLFQLRVKTYQLPELQSQVLADWGISVPINVIRYCLARPELKLLYEYDQARSVYRVTTGHIISEAAVTAEALAKKKYELVASEINREKVRSSSTKLTVDELIFTWLRVAADSILKNGSTASNLSHDEFEANRIFVLALHSSQRAEAFREAITDLALGDMLYQGIVYASEYETLDPDVSAQRSSMNRVSVYLDTGIVLRAMGYFGEAAELAAGELLQMCKATGCALKVFHHTVTESQEGLIAFASRFYSGSNAYGQMRDWALTSGMTKADLIDESSILSERLSAAGIFIEESPPLTK